VTIPDQDLQGEIDGDGRSASIIRVPALGLPKISSLVGRIFIPAFSASPLGRWQVCVSYETRT
jgi:hypothetical protein